MAVIVIDYRRRTERRLSEAVRESCLVDGHFCGEDMSPPQLREGDMTGVIAGPAGAYPAWCAR